jgi:hypothetical protein
MAREQPLETKLSQIFETKKKAAAIAAVTAIAQMNPKWQQSKADE